MILPNSSFDAGVISELFFKRTLKVFNSLDIYVLTPVKVAFNWKLNHE